MKKRFWIFAAVAALIIGVILMVKKPKETKPDSGALPAADVYTDVAILSTTDMHGKCWEENLLTGGSEKNNMLRVSTAVKEIREAYGRENVLLVDNGDLFQGTPVSQTQLLQFIAGESADMPAMAVCLKEIGYDAFELGNHEFNYDWDGMCRVYRYLEDSGIPVLGANICYDGTDGVHESGENVFRPYVIKTITVGDKEHKIGILGIENTDITRWDLPTNYPGIRFSHPGNDNYSITEEAQLYFPEMKEAGCEFIVVCYHGDQGNTEGELRFAVNSQGQGLRLIAGTTDVDLLIAGHDHVSSYSNSFAKDASGRDVLIVNGGGQQLTKTVFRFTEDETGALAWELLSSENIGLGEIEPDSALQEIMAPYAEIAEAEIETPVGYATGEWDGNENFYLEQTDTINLVSAAMIDIPSQRLKEICGAEGAEKLGVEGLDHTDVDIAFTSVTVSNNYTVSAGEISYREIYQLYRYTNRVFVLPMSGKVIREIMEETAADRLEVQEENGEKKAALIGDKFTCIIYGGINFTYDMTQPKGERVKIEGFANGREFKEDSMYLVAVNNYILGNDDCGLRSYGAEDAVWAQQDEDAGAVIQDLIVEYIAQYSEEGGISPERFSWHWRIQVTEDSENG